VVASPIGSPMSTTPTESDTMPSESSFKQHAEAIRSALTVFNAIKVVDAPKPVKAAFDELVVSAAEFQRFAPFFSTHALFQELVPATHLSLEEFLARHPGFERHPLYPKIAILFTRVKEALQTPARKGRIFFQIYFLTFLTFARSISVSVAAANLRPVKGKVSKVPVSTIALPLFSGWGINSRGYFPYSRVSVLAYLKSTSTLKTSWLFFWSLPSLPETVGMAQLGLPTLRMPLPVR
jgi:hypothetical protein